jgi:DNA-directed RNA polymerase subunit H (RpoH/RPB5)
MSMSSIYKPFILVLRSRKYVLEMLKDRGYDTEKYENFTSDEICSMIKSHNAGKYETKAEVGPLDLLLTKNRRDGEEGDKRENIYIKYRLDDKFKKTENLESQISEIYATSLTKNDTLIIMNIARVINKPNIKDKTDDEFVKSFYLTKGYFIQLYGLENFLINISHHKYVSKHRILTKKELVDVAKKNNITNLRNFPLIKRNDPQAKYIGLKPKQVCGIMKKNKTSGESEEYRICVN